MSSAADTANRNVIVVGASAGGVSALRTLVQGLPRELNAAVFIVLHTGPSARSSLHEILQRETQLEVRQATDGEPIRPGQIRVARPDYHLIVDSDKSRLTRGPRENRSRPAIDALFRSAAYSQRARTIGVVLSGALDDGTAGLWWIKNRGGAVVVQDPSDAEWPDMPRSAMAQVQCDRIVPVASMASALTELSRAPAVAVDAAPPRQLEVEVQIAKEGNGFRAGIMELGELTPYTCPECHGVLVQLEQAASPQFRCHTGHAYTMSGLLADVTEYVEATLWKSIRSVEESAMLLSHMARRARKLPSGEAFAQLCEEKAADTLQRAEIVRKAVNEHQTLSVDNIETVARGSR